MLLKKNGHRLHQPYEKHKINAMQWKCCQDIGILHKVKVSNLIPGSCNQETDTQSRILLDDTE